ncbi:MAG: site-specific DNA-methyltransferase [Pyrinomonadaceae bacterium]|jgi:DNA modification methylase|nr:site-specific DNA-methyltransferase [Blastocatellia bacterium]MBA3571129.1 site-specific DNA-methyltransferase [Pyrinomonadaceae bacterium]
MAARNTASPLVDTRVIYCGDNLEQLRKLPPACIDLVYIDPPFNSNRNYEVFWGETKEKRSFEDRHESTKAYIDYMRPRCLELHRVLKKTGSFYYHCDWHASHYVKVMLDQIFGENNFVNEIVWKRQTSHNDAKQGSRHFGRLHDTIFLYVRSDDYVWNHLYGPLDPSYIESHYSQVDEKGRRFQWGDLRAPGGAAPSKGNPHYKVLGVDGYWRYSQEKMEQFVREGRVAIPGKGKTPRFKRYLEESKGLPVGSVWDDINPINSQARESLGYPTQKPLSLLERIINVSSNDNDIVLDAFCGCGTALVAAQKLNRQWIGIDISPTACRVMAQRMKKACGLKEDEKLQQLGRGFIVRDLPKSEAELRKYPPFEFENWAVVALGGTKNARQVGDMGIDGRIYPVTAMPGKRGATVGELDFMDEWYPIQVKQKDKVGRPDIDAFEAVMIREERKLGYFVGFEFTKDALFEIDRFRRKEGREIKTLSVREILDEEVGVT